MDTRRALTPMVRPRFAVQARHAHLRKSGAVDRLLTKTGPPVAVNSVATARRTRATTAERVIAAIMQFTRRASPPRLVFSKTTTERGALSVQGVDLGEPTRGGR